MSDLNNLLNINWIRVPNSPYIMKYLFHDAGYHIMVSDLTCVYSEKVKNDEVMRRFFMRNPFALMKYHVIVERFKQALVSPDLSIIQSTTKNLMFEIKFYSGYVPCNYAMSMQLMEAEKATHHILGPVVLNALLCQRKILELQMKALSHETIKLTSDTVAPPLYTIDPDFLNGQNVSMETLLDSFLKSQTYFKVLYAENLETCNASKKEKSSRESPSEHVSMQKKLKLHESYSKVTSFKFQDDADDSDEKKSIKDDDSDEKKSIKDDDSDEKKSIKDDSDEKKSIKDDDDSVEKKSIKDDSDEKKSIKDDDSDEKKSVKEEETECCDIPSQATKSDVKKKDFRI